MYRRWGLAGTKDSQTMSTMPTMRPRANDSQDLFFFLSSSFKKKDIYLYIFRQRNRNKKAPAVDGLMRSFAFLPVNANGPCLWLFPSAGPCGTIEHKKGAHLKVDSLIGGAGWGPWIKNKKMPLYPRRKKPLIASEALYKV